jgi:ribonuclease HII
VSQRTSHFEDCCDEAERDRIHGLQFHEREARLAGYKTLVGIDEAGRGPLAGPVVAAACSMPAHVAIPGINDSKQLTAPQRLSLFQILTNHPEVLFGLGVVSSDEIDRINILQATIVAMKQAIDNLAKKPDFLLIDGLEIPSHSIPNKKIIGGDASSYLIAAASIIAKETRDRLMGEYDKTWPQYGFRKHKGYPTRAHHIALQKYGPCPIHRMTFAPLKLGLYPSDFKI